MIKFKYSLSLLFESYHTTSGKLLNKEYKFKNECLLNMKRY